MEVNAARNSMTFKYAAVIVESGDCFGGAAFNNVVMSIKEVSQFTKVGAVYSNSVPTPYTGAIHTVGDITYFACRSGTSLCYT